MADNTYVPAGTHFDETIKTAAQGGDTAAKTYSSIIKDAQDEWKKAYATGNQKDMDYWHGVAEAARAQYGYSGGADGTEYIALSGGAVTDFDPTGGSGANFTTYAPADSYKAYTYPAATSAEDYIREIYAAQQEESLTALKNAYEQNVLELDRAAEKIPAEYTQARNSTSGASEINRAAFNEYAAASGLSSGTGGQAQLSMSNALLGGLASISESEANALQELELQRATLRTSYNNSINAAVSKGNFELAQALYKELVRLDEAKLDVAQLQAAENYKAYTANKK